MMSYHFGVDDLIEQRRDEFSEFAERNDRKVEDLAPGYGRQAPPIER